MDRIEDELEAALANLKSREDFARFLSLLLDDCDNNLEFWMNQDLHSFLTGLKDYAETTEAVLDEFDSRQATWRSFADLLLTARSYI
jgi:hypothetical protein